MTLVLFGLTGGLASGKSTVASRFRAHGLPVIDADQIARGVVLPGTPALREIAALFGGGVVRADGTLDRKALAARAFADATRRRALEDVLHPRIAAAAREQARRYEARGEPLACYEASLLVERGLEAQYRPLVVVSAAPAVQLARAGARDGLTQAEAQARLDAQLPLSDKVKAADHVVVNDGDLAELWRQADVVLAAICSELGIDPARYGLSAIS